MARVVVVGGGFGGLATAARLAKLGHDVTVLERLDTLGGAVSTVSADGFEWDAGPTSTLLPAVIRDLFRKSGRPVERELELEPLDLVREHWFEDGTVLGLPGDSRAAQLRAFDELGPGLGRQWVDYVDSFAERLGGAAPRATSRMPWNPADLSREVAERFDSREMLHKRLKKTFKDERLRQVAAHPFVADGHDRATCRPGPGWCAYLEQRFGAWTVTGGMASLTAALTARMATRGVTVATRGRGHRHRGAGRACGRPSRPRREPSTRTWSCARSTRGCCPRSRRTSSARCRRCRRWSATSASRHRCATCRTRWSCTATRCSSSAPAAGPRPAVRRRRCTAAASSPRTSSRPWPGTSSTCAPTWSPGSTCSPRDLVEQWRTSPYGVLWQGRGTVRQRLGPRTPIEGVYAAGAHATPGSGLPFVGLSAALVAQVVGPA